MKIIECPRDAMQGIKEFIPTTLKAAYINQLLRVGFDTIDFGSFVSPKAIPQMADTHSLIKMLQLEGSKTRLLAIVANIRGAKDACSFPEIDYLGYPLSLSETFQQRNTNRSIATAFNDLGEIQELCLKSGKSLVVYLSMGFGNPYKDPYDASYLQEFVDKLKGMNIGIVSLADTIGVADEASIRLAFESLLPHFPKIEFGAHFHALKSQIVERVDAAYLAGCRRFDGAIYGFGGCPMAHDDLVGNMATEVMMGYFNGKNLDLELNTDELKKAMNIANQIF